MHKRYYSLKPNGKGASVSEAYGSDLYGKVILRQAHNNGTREVSHFYVFENYIQAFEFYMKKQVKTFHEIIYGEYPQKLKFDLDISDHSVNHEEIFSDTLDRIIRFFSEKYSIDLNLDRDILVFTSHGESKKSYHIVIDNYSHSNNEEAKYFFNFIYQDSPWKKFLDPGVYNNKQSFRLLWSRKENSDRIKVLQPYFYKNSFHETNFNEPDEELRVLQTFRHSLISETCECKILPDLIPPKSSEEIENTKIFTFDLEKITNLLAEFDPNQTITKVEKNFITLRKKNPYHCRACGGYHENENPFLLVRRGEVWFHCRRSKEKIKMADIETKEAQLETKEVIFEKTEGPSGDQILQLLNKKVPKEKIDPHEIFMKVLK